MSKSRTIGIDEAGRGPILGPMALAAVALTPAGTRALNAAGVTDSKRYGSTPAAQAARSELAALIRTKAASHACVLVEVEEVDRYTFQGKLNALERKVARDLLVCVGATPNDRIICDGARMFAPLSAHYRRFEAVDKGESAHASVAAASILAKVARDEAFSAIASKYALQFGEIRGGGYLNAGTRKFLDAYQAAYGCLPPEARTSWGADKLDVNLSLFDQPQAPR